MADVEGDTALWHAISANHHNIFQILYHCATISDSYTPGYLLCTAAKRNDIRVMKALLRHGLNVDSKDRSGLTAIEIAMSENHVDMVDLLVMNGTDVTDANKYEFCSSTLNGMLRKREVGHRIMVEDTALDELPLRAQEREQGCRLERSNGPYHPRVRIYRGHPMVKKEGCCVGNGRLTRLPSSLVELKRIAGKSQENKRISTDLSKYSYIHYYEPKWFINLNSMAKIEEVHHILLFRKYHIDG